MSGHRQWCGTTTWGWDKVRFIAFHFPCGLEHSLHRNFIKHFCPAWHDGRPPAFSSLKAAACNSLGPQFSSPFRLIRHFLVGHLGYELGHICAHFRKVRGNVDLNMKGFSSGSFCFFLESTLNQTCRKSTISDTERSEGRPQQ